MQQRLLIANWKMNGTYSQIVAACDTYLDSCYSNSSNVVLAVPYVFLSYLYSLGARQFKLAAQDVSKYVGFGAYTGEVSASILANCGVTYVIVGHSERRVHLLESDVMLLEKIRNSCQSGLVPIFCIGESAAVRASGNYLDFIEQQLSILSGILEPTPVVIAYEPIWSIGTGTVPELSQIEEVVDYISEYAVKNFKNLAITIIYGGSVSESNVASLLNLSRLGGVLIGGASLDCMKFANICKIFNS